MFGGLSIGRRVIIGFILMLTLLGSMVIIASLGIGYVVGAAESLLEGNKLRTEFMELEVNHLEWEDSLYAFLTDNKATSLAIPLDYRQCKFGKWLYGPERKLTEMRVPELAPLFKSLEEPHMRLHQAAQEIQATFHRADNQLAKFLVEHAVGNLHLQWLISLGEDINNQTIQSTAIALDINQCPFEQWLQSAQIQQTQTHWHPESRLLWDQMRQAHTKLHTDALSVTRQLIQYRTGTTTAQSISPERIFLTKVLPDLRDMTANLAAIKSIALQDIEKENQADEILRGENLSHHKLLQQKLNEIRMLVDKKMVTDEKMLVLAQDTRGLILGIGLLALLLAIMMTMRIRRDIVTPLNYLTNQLTVDCTNVQPHATLPSHDDGYNVNYTLVTGPFLKTLLTGPFLKWMHFYNLLKLVRLFTFMRRPGMGNTTHNNIKPRTHKAEPHSKRKGVLHLLSTSDVPVEVASLARAISRYTEYQTSMVVEQQRFIANVAHQLKNPLAGIYIQMDMILEDFATQPPELRDRMLKLNDAIHRVGRLTHQLLALARCGPEAIDKQAMQAINLNDLIAENASSWFDAALPKQIDLGFEIESALISGVPWLLSEMLNNLVDNAIKHSHIKGKITVRCGYRSNYIPGYTNRRPFLEVEDNGSGIPLSEREKVFERFYRVGTSSDVRDDGVGLGLAIVKEVTRYHQATIDISTPSTTATGTLFAIEFPLSNHHVTPHIHTGSI